MVGRQERDRRLIDEVEALYEWIDAQQRRNPVQAGACRACGACCDFTAYDHRLFVTLPELIYLADKLGTQDLKQMTSGRCPYRQATKCTVHPYRFAGCRIFCCQGDPDFQSDLTEAALKRLKSLCEEYQVPYRYTDLATALAAFSTDIGQSAVGPCPGDRAG